MKKIFTATTQTVEGARIETYKGLISSHIVIGTNFFADFGASLTDVFGGYSDTYQNKLQKIYTAAISELENKAAAQGCNAVVGIRMDFSEISGKGKSMFMVSAYGTGVVIKFEHQTANTGDVKVVDLYDLQKSLVKQDLLRNLPHINPFFNSDIWRQIAFAPSIEYAGVILNWFLNAQESGTPNETDKLVINNSILYFESMDRGEVSDFLYNEIEKRNKNEIADLIIKIQLFSSSRIIDLINKGKISEAICCLPADKETYSAADLDDMRIILNLLENLPDKGSIEDMSSKLSGKIKTKYICQNQHQNDADVIYCNNCNLNIKGLNIYEQQKINTFKDKVTALALLFDNQE